MEQGIDLQLKALVGKCDSYNPKELPSIWLMDEKQLKEYLNDNSGRKKTKIES